MTVYPVVVRARLDEPLSGWLWLVKWLLLIPQVLIVGAFSTGGYVVEGVTSAGERWYVQMPGLLSICVLIAAVAVLFTRRYPGGLFDFVIGMNRWGLRVTAYVALMTDAYPPFRLDQGPHEPPPADEPEDSP